MEAWKKQIRQREADARVPLTSDLRHPHTAAERLTSVAAPSLIDLSAKRWKSSHPWLLPAHSWNRQPRASDGTRSDSERRGAVFYQAEVHGVLPRTPLTTAANIVMKKNDIPQFEKKILIQMLCAEASRLPLLILCFTLRALTSNIYTPLRSFSTDFHFLQRSVY